MIPSEFKHVKAATEIFTSEGLNPARMISGSKSGYRRMHPDHEVYFNANIVVESMGKIWYGDLDIDVDRPALERIAKQIDEPLYVLYEMDCRFGAETNPIQELISGAQVVISN